MIDRHEMILQRLLTVLGAVEGIRGAYRNRGDLPPRDKTPGIILLDNAEKIHTPLRGQQFNEMVSAYFTMSPEVFLVLTPRDTSANDTFDDLPAPVGQELSSFRMKILSAVINDDTLIALVGDGGQIEYRGYDTDMRSGSSIGAFGAQMQLHFTFTYALRTQDL